MNSLLLIGQRRGELTHHADDAAVRDLDDRISRVQLTDPVREDGPTPDHSQIRPLDIRAGLLEVAACLAVDQPKLECAAKQRLELVVVAYTKI